ncbi:hypothetical protein ACNKU7_12105 [Microbulbifer sp. SA54]|uniref:hypothetical protein n=1 Tax=Microbulbifer sp. SA54 TaxID=3401577 RepID=UPI003AAD7D73
MARKKSKDDALLVLLIILVAAVIAVVLLTPVVLVAGFVRNQFRALKYRRRFVNEHGRVWLNEREKEAFLKWVEDLRRAELEIDEAVEKGEREGVSRNVDGTFSARSKLGKELRSIMDRCMPLRQELFDNLERLQKLPQTRWNKLNRYTGKAHAFAFGLLAWCGAMGYYIIEQGRQIGADLLNVYWAFATNILREDRHDLPLSGYDIEMLLVSTTAAVVAYWLGRLLFFRAARRYAPRPQLVTAKNIASFGEDYLKP